MCRWQVGPGVGAATYGLTTRPMSQTCYNHGAPPVKKNSNGSNNDSKQQQPFLRPISSPHTILGVLCRYELCAVLDCPFPCLAQQFCTTRGQTLQNGLKYQKRDKHNRRQYKKCGKRLPYTGPCGLCRMMHTVHRKLGIPHHSLRYDQYNSGLTPWGLKPPTTISWPGKYFWFARQLTCNRLQLVCYRHQIA